MQQKSNAFHLIFINKIIRVHAVSVDRMLRSDFLSIKSVAYKTCIAK